MQSTQSTSPLEEIPALYSGRTSPAFSAPRTTLSDASWENWLERALPCRPPQEDGRVRVWLADPRERLRGGSSTLNISECPNDVVESFLSQVLEKDSIPQKYYLSIRACEGILRRARNRNVTLPDTLREVLEHTVKSGLPRPSDPQGEPSAAEANPS